MCRGGQRNIHCMHLRVHTILQARCLSLVLLRRLITNEWAEIANELDAQTMHSFKEALLNAVQGSSLKLLQKRYADVVAEVARFSVGRRQLCSFPMGRAYTYRFL